MHLNFKQAGVIATATVLLGALLAACGETAPAAGVATVRPAASLQDASPAVSPAPAASPTAALKLPAPTATPGLTRLSGKIGEGMTLENGYILTVHQTERAKSFTKVAASTPGNILIALEISLENPLEKTINFDYNKMVVRDSEANTYSVQIYGKFPALHDYSRAYVTPIGKAGGMIRGWLTYQVPETASGLTFEYRWINETTLITVGLD